MNQRSRIQILWQPHINSFEVISFINFDTLNSIYSILSLDQQMDSYMAPKLRRTDVDATR